MKKTIFVLFSLLISFLGYAQKFTILNNEVVNASDHSKNYVVIDAPDKTSEIIKDILVNTLSKMYAHPDKVISVVGNNIIVVNGYAPDLFTQTGTYNGFNGATTYTTEYSTDYSYRIEIKDNKIKVNAPIFSNLYYTLKMHGKTKTNGPFGESDFFEAVKEAKASTKVEKMMNDFLHCLDLGLNIQEDW